MDKFWHHWATVFAVMEVVCCSSFSWSLQPSLKPNPLSPNPAIGRAAIRVKKQRFHNMNNFQYYWQQLFEIVRACTTRPMLGILRKIWLIFWSSLLCSSFSWSLQPSLKPNSLSQSSCWTSSNDNAMQFFKKNYWKGRGAFAATSSDNVQTNNIGKDKLEGQAITEVTMQCAI